MKQEFKIDLDIYKENSIQNSIKDFKDFWDIQLHWDILTIYWESKWEIKEIFNEFMNYVIWL